MNTFDQEQIVDKLRRNFREQNEIYAILNAVTRRMHKCIHDQDTDELLEQLKKRGQLIAEISRSNKDIENELAIWGGCKEVFLPADREEIGTLIDGLKKSISTLMLTDSQIKKMTLDHISCLKGKINHVRSGKQLTKFISNYQNRERIPRYMDRKA